MQGATVKAEFADPMQQSANSATSGPDGRFEIIAVPPGSPLVRVDPVGGGLVWHRVMYYPGVHQRDAALPVIVDAGAQVEIEIRMREIPTATIRTTLSGPEGLMHFRASRSKAPKSVSSTTRLKRKPKRFAAARS